MFCNFERVAVDTEPVVDDHSARVQSITLGSVNRASVDASTMDLSST